MDPHKIDLLQGTLDMLILRTLAGAPLHGWGVAKRIRAMSGERLEIQEGSLYPALYRLRDQGLIRGKWGVSPEGRRARFYSLTRTGKKRLADETRGWELFCLAVNAVLEG